MEKFKNNNFKGKLALKKIQFQFKYLIKTFALITDKKSPHQNQRRPNNHENSQNEKNNQHKNASNKNKTIINDNDKKKVHYVLNPRALRKKIKDIKEMDQRVKEKEHQTKSKFPHLKIFNFR